MNMNILYVILNILKLSCFGSYGWRLNSVFYAAWSDERLFILSSIKLIRKILIIFSWN